ncbi:hypothetical protein N7532_011619 [Penicillium argentinense]|uniref:Uncharacterized protein n=1 Tax=Penicillium argentinense TaxID=1131581 RepID=A0A9W9JV66_9EURO|nr:uncharacterized protein N7532_011619 [Penicillium argentinense]KAJ5082576.1 hypothetical protein N7532_011619 [Penicillium argentinense]
MCHRLATAASLQDVGFDLRNAIQEQGVETLTDTCLRLSEKWIVLERQARKEKPSHPRNRLPRNLRNVELVVVVQALSDDGVIADGEAAVVDEVAAGGEVEAEAVAEEVIAGEGLGLACM